MRAPGILGGNLGDLVREDIDPGKTALIELGAEGQASYYTYGDIEREVGEVAAAMRARHLPVDASVAILGDNTAAYLFAYLGIMRAGLVAVPVNHRLPQDMLDYILNDAGVELVLKDEALPPVGGWPTAILGKLPAAGAQVTRDAEPAADTDPSLVIYTSGSTGKPKGVILPHRAQLLAMAQWDADRAELSQHVLNIAAPLFHMNGLFLIKLALWMGATAVLHHSFQPRAYLDAIERYDVSWLTGITTMFAMLLPHAAELPAESKAQVRKIGLGSAPVTPSLFTSLQELFPQAAITNLYGTTEHGPTAFGPHPDGKPTPYGSIGYKAANVELRIGEDGHGSQGVLYVRSPMNMLGYRNRPELTAQVMRDGWYRTGDVVRIDEDGFFYCVGREDDMFICNGENMYPADIERTLERHPAVRQACVVPVEDSVRGAVPIAFVVLDAPIEEHELQAFARQEGPAVQYPRVITFVEGLPLLGSNKLDRGTIANWAVSIKVPRKETLSS